MSKRILAAFTAAALTFGTMSYQAVAQSSSSTFLHDTTALKWESRGSKKTMKIVDAETPSGQAINTKIKKRNRNPWDVALWVEMDGAVKKGDEVQILFWARTDKAPKSKDLAEFVVFVGRNEEPFDNIISEEFSPENEWKAYTLTGIADADYKPGTLKAEYQIGKHAQTIEFGGMYVSNLGPKTE